MLARKDNNETTSPLLFSDHTYWALYVLFCEISKPRDGKPKPKDWRKRARVKAKTDQRDCVPTD